jgi:hypothetical protein
MKFDALQRLFSTIYIFSDSMLWNANTREQIQNPCIAATAENMVGESKTLHISTFDTARHLAWPAQLHDSRRKANRSSGTLIDWKSGKTTYVPLWDRIEVTWLWTLNSRVLVAACLSCTNSVCWEFSFFEGEQSG